MKKILSILFLIAAFSASAFEYRTVQTYTNGVLQSPTTLWVANSNGINAVIKHPAQSLTNTVAIFDGVLITPFSTTNIDQAHAYWLDFGKSNALGQNLIYQSVTATTNIVFWGITNCSRWRLLSVNVLASGRDCTVYFPTNLPHLGTNTLTYAVGKGWGVVVSNGQNAVLTLQSNANTMSSIWTISDQQ